MIAQELEGKLHEAFAQAREMRHEQITVEHMLVSILSDTSVQRILVAKAVDVDKLRSDLSTHIKNSAAIQGGAEDVDSEPTLGFQRVIQRAILWVQQNVSGSKEVTGAHVLMAIYGEKGPAAQYMHASGLTRLDVEALVKKPPQGTAPASYLDSRRPSLPEAMWLEGGTVETAHASLVKKGYFTPPPRPWSLGFHDRGMGRGGYAVLDKFGDPVVQASDKTTAEHIIEAVNAWKE